MTIYDRIKARRAELQMTQEELAAKLGYAGKSMISRVESGEIDLPQSKVIAFAKALRTTPKYLMGWDEKDTEAALGEIDTSEVSLRLRDDKDMVQALKVYFKMPPEKKKHVIETIHLIGDKK